MCNIPNIDLIKKDLSDFYCTDQQKLGPTNNVSTVKNVLLTGSTGFLGQNLLIDLLKYTDYNVYCLVRVKKDQDAKQKLFNSLMNAGYSQYANNSRIIILPGDLNLENLGLAIDTLKMLESNIDAIYHCGAYVHHLHTYKTLRSDVLSTYFLVQLSTTTKLKQLNFISTMNISNPNNNIWRPAENLQDIPFCNMGYIQVKWVCEKILYSYIDQGYPFYVYRPGNITGHSQTGYSVPYSNHALLLVKGFIQDLRAPKWQELLDMTPVDLVSKSVIMLSKNTELSKFNTFNLHNSATITWEEFLAKIANILKLKIEFVDKQYWRLNILPNIGRHNALSPFRDFYSLDNSNFNAQPPQDKVTEELLLQLGIKFPSKTDYNELIRLYMLFLLKIKFIDCTDILEN